MNSNIEVPCPSCGFFTIGENSFGTYNICEICGWEDDGVQLANPTCDGGANGKSLAYYQKMSLTEFPLNVHDHQGIKRDSKWRPLSDSEIELYEKEKKEKYWKNKSVLSLSEVYWVNNLA